MFNAILRKIREGVGLLTPDLIVLRAFHSAVGYQEVELLGQSVLTMIHADDTSRFQESFSQLLSAQAKSTSCEVRVKKGDGSWAWVVFEMTDLLDDPDVSDSCEHSNYK
jgi:PAS domain S-box-containing protein